MRNRTEIVGVSIPDRLRQAALTHRARLLPVGAALTGYVMSNSFLFGGVAPFGAAFCAVLSWRYVTAAALGSILGHVFSLGNIANMKYIAAILLIVVLKWVLSQRNPLRLPQGAEAVLCALSGMLVSSGILLVAMDYTLYDVLTSVAELLLCCGAAYFFARTLGCLELGFGGASRSDLSCVVVSFAVIVMGFSGMTVAGASIGRILCVFLILMAARYGKEAGGAIAGVTAGIAMGLSGGDFAYIVSAYSFGGLMSGVFGHVGRLAAASSFVVVNALAAIFVGSSVDAYIAVVEIFVASAAFMALPSGVLKRLQLLPSGTQGEEGEAQLALKQRIRDVSRTLRQIGETTHEISRRLGKMGRNDLADIYAKVASQVCRHCGMRTACWQENYNSTMSALSDCVRTMRRGGTVNREQVPAHFVKTCVKLDGVIGELNAQFQQQLSREGVARKVSQVRSVVTDQFDGMAMMIDEMAGDLATRRPLPRDQCRRARDYFEKRGVEAEQLFCYQDAEGRAHLELHLPTWQSGRVERVKAALDLSALLETEFDTPELEEDDKTVRVLFSEKAAFTAVVGAFQISRGRGRLCGDSYETVRDRGGRQHLILSDGMGTGGSAAVDSAMASGLIARLLGVGVSHGAALKMVNSALLIKSGDESLATIDVCTVDLFTGQTSFYKAGAAPSYVLRAGKSGYVESTSLPAGILSDVAFEKSSVTLGAGDMAVMVSDGVTATGGDWLLSELRSIGAGDVQRLCESVANTAATRRVDRHGDDITVLAVKLQKGL